MFVPMFLSSSYSQSFALIFEVNKHSNSCQNMAKELGCFTVLCSKSSCHHLCIWLGSYDSRVMKLLDFETENQIICKMMECQNVTMSEEVKGKNAFVCSPENYSGKALYTSLPTATKQENCQAQGTLLCMWKLSRNESGTTCQLLEIERRKVSTLFPLPIYKAFLLAYKSQSRYLSICRAWLPTSLLAAASTSLLAVRACCC